MSWWATSGLGASKLELVVSLLLHVSAHSWHLCGGARPATLPCHQANLWAKSDPRRVLAAAGLASFCAETQLRHRAC
eukprot:428670-Amphidinium_carterae.1